LTLLRHSAAGIDGLTRDGTLGQRIAEQMRHRMGQAPSPGEIRSWNRSLPVLVQDVLQAGLGKVEVLVEHRLPLTSQRVDVILAGQHPRTRGPSYVLVELKQWTGATLYEGDPNLVLVNGYSYDPRLHPAAQVSRYCQYLMDFTRALQDEHDPVGGVAYLHNATDSGVAALRRRPQDPLSRMFTGQRRADFLAYLRSRLDPDVDGAAAADRLLNSASTPSRQLLALAADEIQNREQFVLIGNQQLAYDLVLHAVQEARENNRKTAVIVTGGPGSGKSVEAHRIRETSADRWTRAALRTGRPQVEELLAAARVPVFLLDEHQVVRPGEMGTATDIEQHAGRRGLDVYTVTLGEQFRCGGSKEYEHWVLRLLGLAPGGPVRWEGDKDFEVRIAESPSEMEDRLARLLAAGEGARLAAGYCWHWSDPSGSSL
jgi:hypothetical protein